jgi:arylsulfatase A-like enzyme
MKRFQNAVRIVAVVLPSLLLVSGCSQPEEAAESPDRRPEGTLEDLATLAERDDVNLLYIVVDTLRSDRLSAYGYERDTSPNLNYFSRTGIRFDQHWAQSSWTKTSMASLWTGLYPARTEVLDHRDIVAPAVDMPAEVLGRAGFTTAGIWRNGWIAPNFGFGQGFEVYASPAGQQSPSTMRQPARAGRIDGTDIDLVFSAIEFLRANGDRRWFLYLHMMDVHQYITTPDNALFGSTYSDAYDNSIRWTDEQVGMILTELHALDLARKTLVVLVSDHGEAFGEHGAEGHARDVFREVVRTPFLLIPPFMMRTGIVVPFATQNVDVWPTLYDLLGVEGPEQRDGVSLAPLLLERRPVRDEDLTISHLNAAWGRKDTDPISIVGIRLGGFRLIHDSRSPDADLLFDLERDPLEAEDVASAYNDTASDLRARVEEYLELKAPWEGGAPEIELDEMHLRQLRALGYSVED